MTIQLSKEVYCKAALVRAVQDYAAIAQIHISESAKYYNCKIKQSVYDYHLTAAEFENYMIAMMNQKEYIETRPLKAE